MELLTMTHDKNDNTYLNIDRIDSPAIKEFVIESINQFGNAKKLKTANKVADVVWQKFVHEGYVTPVVKQGFVEITLAACLLHNLFYKKEDITTILVHRKKLEPIREKCGIDERAANFIYEIIESQLGMNHPIQRLKPQTNSPSHTFSEAVWYVTGYSSNF